MYPLIEMTIILRSPKRYIQDVQYPIESWFYIEQEPGNIEVHYNNRQREFLRPVDVGEYVTITTDPDLKSIFCGGGSSTPRVPIPNLITWKGW
jgi:hypothetical protein